MSRSLKGISVRYESNSLEGEEFLRLFFPERIVKSALAEMLRGFRHDFACFSVSIRGTNVLPAKKAMANVRKVKGAVIFDVVFELEDMAGIYGRGSAHHSFPERHRHSRIAARCKLSLSHRGLEFRNMIFDHLYLLAKRRNAHQESRWLDFLKKNQANGFGVVGSKRSVMKR
jgi:hypothetical protein